VLLLDRPEIAHPFWLEIKLFIFYVVEIKGRRKTAYLIPEFVIRSN
jgi:hypothetical protein